MYTCLVGRKQMNRNIVLIGMPGAGKSTVGVVLAKKLGYRFVDSDLVIQDTYGKLLHELKRSVIATGGSAVYGAEAMEHLRKIGTVIYLQLPFEEIAGRLGDLSARGVTLREGQTLSDLYAERVPLYEKYAHLTIDCRGKMLRQVVETIVEQLGKADLR